MRTVPEILRLHFESGLSRRQIARSCNLSHSTVVTYLKRAVQAQLSWPLPKEMDDTALERLITAPAATPPARRPLPDTAYLLQEMRKKHVTLALLWQEYRDTPPDGYGYTQFCHYYHEARRRLDVTLRQEHREGSKLFTDFAGDTLPVVDPHTGDSHLSLSLRRGPGRQQLHLRPRRDEHEERPTGSSCMSRRWSSWGASPRSSCPITPPAPGCAPTATSPI